MSASPPPPPPAGPFSNGAPPVPYPNGPPQDPFSNNPQPQAPFANGVAPGPFANGPPPPQPPPAAAAPGAGVPYQAEGAAGAGAGVPAVPMPSPPTSQGNNANNKDNQSDGPQIKVLFAGCNNICRSQAAVSVFRVLAYQKGVAPWFTVESCGTGGGNVEWHRVGGGGGSIGKVVNDRIRMAGGKRGLVVDGVSRSMIPDEFFDSTIVVAMDGQVLEELKKAARAWGVQTSRADCAEIRKLSEFSNRKEFRGRAMPDPSYLFHDELFDHVLDLLEECCAGLLDYLVGQVAPGFNG